MTMLTLIRLRPDLSALTYAVARAGWLPPGGDLGYGLHAALIALFGPKLAPKPFVLRESGSGQELLGYSRALPAEIEEALSLPPLDRRDLAETLVPSSAEIKPMPDDWRRGQRIDIEVRCWPVKRSRMGRPADDPHHHVAERDIFLDAIEPDRDPPAAPGANHGLRESAYRDWLARELGRAGAAQLDSARLKAFQRVRLLARHQTGKRKSAVTEGPDATLNAGITVADPEAFGALLARGVGRRRSFGFGMLLLAPPGRLMGA